MIVILLLTKVFILCWVRMTSVIRMCKPVTVTNKSRYTIEFSDFQHADEDSCQCSFIAPSHGEFNMAPTSFTAVNNCGTKVEVRISNAVVAGGWVECTPSAFLPASALTGEKVTVTVSRTSTSSKVSPYCYVVTFPTNVTFTCTNEKLTSTTASATSSIFKTTTASATSLSRSTISTRQFSRMTSMTLSSASKATSRTEVSTKTTRSELAEEKTCPTSGYIAGLALQSVIICVLIGVITILLWKRQKEMKNDKQSHVYMQSTSFNDVGNTDAYESIRNQSQNNIYLNTALAKD